MAFYDQLKKLAGDLHLDVLSVYLLDEKREELELIESYGLFEEAVGARIPITKGLVGRCARTGLPVAVKNPANDPDFYYLPGSGEERLHSFLALPIKDDGDKLKAVVVAQTIEAKVFKLSEIERIYTTLVPLIVSFLAKTILTHR
jgi:phosphotransferase system enzyme I (PtsP)